MSTVDLAEAICSVRPGSLPVEARRLAQLAIMDTIGVGLAGSTEEATRIARQVALAQGGIPAAALWGTADRTGPLDAALVNGVAAHVLDLDDTNRSMRGHPSVPLVPALLALAEERRLPGRAVVDAYIVGFEVECKLGSLMNLEHYERGWHTTSTLGTLGVAAAAGWLIGLDPKRATSALAIASSMSSGLVRNFGSMTKPLHVGHAARSGLLAALLAEGGFTGRAEVMEWQDGFVEIFSGRSGSDLSGMVKRFGRPWDVLDPGIAFKLYPSCSLTHPPLDAAIELVRQHTIRPDQIESVTCYGNYRCPMVLMYRTPQDSLQAKFSMEYALAAAFCDGRAGIDQFSDARVRQPDVQALQRRVEFHVHPELQTRESLAHDFSIVQVDLKGGRRLEMRVGAPKGSPENPVSDQTLAAKFLDCALRVLPKHRAEAALALLQRLESVEDLGSLIGNLSSTP